MNILTRITDKILCVYIHACQIIKKQGPGLYNSLHCADNRKYFLGLSLTWNWKEEHVFYLAREEGKIWKCSCKEKGNFIIINSNMVKAEKIWPSLLSLSLYGAFKVSFIRICKTDVFNITPDWVFLDI